MMKLHASFVPIFTTVTAVIKSKLYKEISQLFLLTQENGYIKFHFKPTKLLRVKCLTYLELPWCENYIENLNSFNGLMELLSHF